jgi:hypothetical protein
VPQQEKRAGFPAGSASVFSVVMGRYTLKVVPLPGSL